MLVIRRDQLETLEATAIDELACRLVRWVDGSGFGEDLEVAAGAAGFSRAEAAVSLVRRAVGHGLRDRRVIVFHALVSLVDPEFLEDSWVEALLGRERLRAPTKAALLLDHYRGLELDGEDGDRQQSVLTAVEGFGS